MNNTNRHFYTRFNDIWESELKKIIPIETKPDIREIDNAVLLPLRRRKDLQVKAFEGGVVNNRGQFVSGVQRSKRNFQLPFSCNKGYRVDNARYVDEKTVFGGVIFGHFGHVLIDTCSRLWHFAENPDDGLKRVFVSTPETTFKYGKLFDLSGMVWKIIEEPTRFREVVVPGEAFFSNDRGSKTWLEWWGFLKKKALQIANHGQFYDKIYLTRTQFAGNDGINEEFYENYWQKLGYTVISPEKLPLEEQICLISHAKSVVCTMGTLAHMLVFAQDGIDVTLLLRSPSTIMRGQMAINTLRRFNWRCVEATINPLPTSQSNGVFFYAPTPQFREFCAENDLPQPEDFAPTPEMTEAYLRKWVANYSKMLSWHYIQKTPCVDFLAALSYFLTGTDIDKKAYADHKY